MTDLWANCALAAFIDALPMDDGHMERSKRLAYQYYNDEVRKNGGNENGDAKAR